MTLIARFPRFSAWVVALVLVAMLTWGGVLGLRALEPAVPAGLAHVHGVIVAVHADGVFGVRVPGQASILWFRPAPGAPISRDHLLRHLREGAATDIFYQIEPQGVWLAWEAD